MSTIDIRPQCKLESKYEKTVTKFRPNLDPSALTGTVGRCILHTCWRAHAESEGNVNDGDCLVMRLTGNLKEERGSTPIIGEDVVVIQEKGN